MTLFSYQPAESHAYVLQSVPDFDVDQLPAAVHEAATARDVQLTLEQWALLSELDRFALCKLARPGHDHHNLEAAFSEVLV